MPLADDLVRMIGFVVEDDKPIGTCFLVRVRSALHPTRPDWDHGYLVTAGHVAPPDSLRREVWMPTYEGDLITGLDPTWVHHEGGADVAVAPFNTADDTRNWASLRMYDQTTIDPRYFKHLSYGLPVIYAGLLLPIRSMAGRGQPMVRSAAIGAFSVADVSYGQYRARLAHLIDCRSRSGFSGSPCFIDVGYPGPRKHELPPEFNRGTMAQVADSIGGMWHHNALWGMLVGYGDDPGVGVVVPVEQIHEALDHPELVTMRQEQDAERDEREQAEGNGFEAIRADTDTSEFEAFEDLTRRLMRVPKTEIDEAAAERKNDR